MATDDSDTPELRHWQSSMLHRWWRRAVVGSVHHGEVVDRIRGDIDLYLCITDLCRREDLQSDEWIFQPQSYTRVGARQGDGHVRPHGVLDRRCEKVHQHD